MRRARGWTRIGRSGTVRIAFIGSSVLAGEARRDKRRLYTSPSTATSRHHSMERRCAWGRTPLAIQFQLADAAALFERVVEHVAQLVRARVVLAGDGFVLALEHLV